MLRRGLWLVPFLMGLAAMFAVFGIGGPLRAGREIERRIAAYRARAVAPAQPIVEEEHAAISLMSGAYVGAVLRGDAAAFAAVFDTEAIVVPGVGPIVRGASEIQRAMAQTFATLRFLEADMSTVDLRITGETAVETGRFRYVVRAGSDSPRTLVGRYAMVWKRVSEGWRLSLDMAQPGVVET